MKLPSDSSSSLDHFNEGVGVGSFSITQHFYVFTTVYENSLSKIKKVYHIFHLEILEIST